MSFQKRKFILVNLFLLFLVFASCGLQDDEKNRIDLSGDWSFKIDSLDIGKEDKWFAENLSDKIQLPGSMTTNGKGDDISLKTPWTGSIMDSSYFNEEKYAKYRKPNNIKIPFWLQPVKYYKGAAWYQKEVFIPETWNNQHIELFIERSHWETTVWVDNHEIGMQNSLGTPHVFDLSKALTPGNHKLSVRIDNRIKDINVGINSHSITDHTQTNWNGMIGELFIAMRPAIYIENIQLYPDIKNKNVLVKVKINNTQKDAEGIIELMVESDNPEAEKLKPLSKEIKINEGTDFVELKYPMGDNPLLWDEFNPNLYSINVSLSANNKIDQKDITFGMREFSTRGTQFTINGNLTFLRGTMEGAIFPKTGFPSTDVEEWTRIFKVSKSFGLNHIRFHSWCPPEAAFIAADQLGFYLQIEASSWANQGATIGDGGPLDKYIYQESERMIEAYGNHPSLVMMAYGNEPAGDNHIEYLTDFVKHWQKKDDRFLYTTGSGWPVIPESDFNSTPEPRIQRWGEGLESIINKEAPRTDYDWRDMISNYTQPTVSHEIGQWVVYPNFKEIPKYDGVLKAKNFEIFQETLVDNGMAKLQDSLLLASGKLQVLCYKADIEAALRTPNFGGFQLLDLHDFPGQGTALVGVLDPFWEEKGYVTAEEYSQFNNSTVPLARFPKMVYLNDEELNVPVEVAHFGSKPLNKTIPLWQLKYEDGTVFAEGELPETNIPLGNNFKLGTIQKSLAELKEAQSLKLTVSVNNFENSWDIWVYPTQLPNISDQDEIKITQKFDQSIIDDLKNGGTVLLSLPKGSIKPEKGGDIAIGFSSIFWNTAWTNGQAPHTLGILCNPDHPALKEFPTEFHSDWQWWDAMSHSNAIKLDAISPELKPIVRVIDDWFTARPLGLIFECKIGEGRLLVSGIDLISDQENRPEAKQLLHSLKKYMTSEDFNPKLEISSQKIRDLVIN